MDRAVNILTGIQGETGPQGFDGAQGISGATGVLGFSGFQGFDGLKGAQGFDGSKGAQGFMGFQGPPGGPEGEEGEEGNEGDEGPSQGYQGPDGIEGPIGSTGISGDDGSSGSIGVQGAQGTQGILGPLGFKGSDGDVGILGPQGVHGLRGSTGPQGIQGPTGSGTIGPQGPQGLSNVVGGMGATGAIGLPGPASANPTVIESTSATGTFTRSNALYTFTNNGTITFNQSTIVNYCIVGGGGGGGGGGTSSFGGGGGGGRTNIGTSTISPGTYTVTVGAGGAGGNSSRTTASGTSGGTGGTSSLIGGSVNLSATGGIGGTTSGSGGNSTFSGAGPAGPAGGGGGGAGSAGLSGSILTTSSQSGIGGNGVLFTPTNLRYGGGGGGGLGIRSGVTYSNFASGTDGGANGGFPLVSAGSVIDNRGGGGGGGGMTQSGTTSRSSSGSLGVVILSLSLPPTPPSAIGATGATGATGAQGVTGNVGATGATGIGIQGATGVPGTAGERGATGPQGFMGNQGSLGPTGITGTQGFQGFQGSVGDGTVGQTGTSGATGIQGLEGAAGSVRGVQGATGSVGPSGVAGVNVTDNPPYQSGLKYSAYSGYFNDDPTFFDLNSHLETLPSSAMAYNNTGTGVYISTAQSRIGGSSLYMPGNPDNRLMISNFPASRLAGISWTIEYFVYIRAGLGTSGEATPISINGNTGNYLIYTPVFLSNSTIRFFVGTTAGSANIFNGNSISAAYTVNAWNHIAICCVNGVRYRCLLNGNSVATSATTTNMGNLLTRWSLGTFFDGTNHNNGGGMGNFLDGIRVSNIARYDAATYTVPENYDDWSNTIYIHYFEGPNNSFNVREGELLLDTGGNPIQSTTEYISPTRACISTLQARMGTSSLYLPGSRSNNVTLTNFPAHRLTTGWTIEYFAHIPTGHVSFGAIDSIAISMGAPNAAHLLISGFRNGNAIWWLGTTAGSFNLANAAGTAITAGWVHFAACYNGRAYQLFANGVSIGTYASATNIGSSLTYWVYGAYFDNTTPFINGGFGISVDAVRVSDIVRYTGTYTPPTTYTFDSNTVYTNLFEGPDVSFNYNLAETYYLPSSVSSVYQATSPTTITANNSNCVISTGVTARIGTASLFVPGESRLTMTNFPATSRLSNAWTIEFFIYIPTGHVSTTATGATLFSAGSASTGSLIFIQGISNNIRFNIGTTNGAWNIVNGSSVGIPSTNAWSHFAICFVNGTYQWYINGTVVNRTTVAGQTNVGPSLETFVFGSQFNNAGVFSGGGNGIYMDALRVSDIVRYAGPYTSPTSYTIDRNTVYVNSFDGTNNSTVFNSSEAYYVISNESSYTTDTAPTSFVTTGTPTISTTQARIGSSSLLLPTGTSRLLLNFTPLIGRLSNTWTIEWSVFIPTGHVSIGGTSSCTLSIGNLQNTNGSIFIQTIDNNAFRTLASSSAYNSWNIFDSGTPTTALTANAWNHFALTYASGSYQLFMRGTCLGATAFHGVNIASNFTHWNFGSFWTNGTPTYSLSGNGLLLDGLRISDCVRYSGTYTPPTTFTVDNNTVYIHSFEGSNGSTTFSGGEAYYYFASSLTTSPLTYSRTGTPTISTTQFRIGTSSLSLPTGTNYVTLTPFPVSQLSNAWTIEFFVFIPTGHVSTGASESIIMSFAGNSGSLIYLSIISNLFRLFIGSVNGTWNIANNLSLGSFTQGIWNHVAISYSGFNYQTFIRGSSAGSTSLSANIGSSIRNWHFGANVNASNVFSGSGNGIFIDGLRVSNNLRYSGTFTVPTTYTLDAHTVYVNTFEGADGSSTFTTGESYYNNIGTQNTSTSSITLARQPSIYTTTSQSRIGSSSLYLPSVVTENITISSFPGNTRLSSSWTFECFGFVPVGHPGLGGATAYEFLSFGGGNGVGSLIDFFIQTGRVRSSITLSIFNGANSVNSVVTGGTWAHMAVCFSGTTYDFFVNGNFIQSSNNTTNIGESLQILYPGRAVNSSNVSSSPAVGLLLDGIRISNTVRYSTTTYVVPTVYTPDRFTVYTHSFEGSNNETVFTTGEAYYLPSTSLTTMNPLSTVFNQSGSGVVISNTQGRIGSSSLLLPGNSNNRLVMTNFPASRIVNSFTIEWFVFVPTGHVSTGSSESVPLSIGGTSGVGALIYVNLLNGISNWYVGTANGTWNIFNASPSAPFSVNAWNHYALCYNSSTGYRCFFNGVVVATSTVVTPIGSILTNWNFGANVNTSNTFSTGGNGCFVDGLCVSDIERYTTTFSPPSSYIEDVNTVYINTFEGSNNSTVFNRGETYYNSPVTSSALLNTLGAGTNNQLASREQFSVVWTGYFLADATGAWTFFTNTTNASYLWLGAAAVSGYTTSNALVSNGGIHGLQERSGTINLVANTYYPIRFCASNATGTASIAMSFQGPFRSKTSNGDGFLFTTANKTWSVDPTYNLRIGGLGSNIYPLNRLSSATLASIRAVFSFTLLSSGYTGPVIRIRRSSDNATMDFFADAYGKLGTAALGTGTLLSTWLGNNTGFVTTWYDQSGNGNHGTQTTQANQPSISGTDTIQFTSGRILNLPNGTVPTGDTPYTVTYRHKDINNANGGILNSGTGFISGQQNAFRRSSTSYYHYWWDYDMQGGSYALENIVTETYQPIGRLRTLYVNSVLATTNRPSNGRISTGGNNWIGQGVNTAETLNGRLYSLFIFQSSLSDPDRLIMENAQNSINGYYGEVPQNNTIVNSLTYLYQASLSVTQLKFGSSSAFFASGNPLNYISVKSFPSSSFTGAWTYECWVYPTTVSGTQTIWSSSQTGATNAYMIVFCSNNRFAMSLGNTGTSWNITNSTGIVTTIVANQWYHVALTFNGTNNYRLWVNGVSELNLTNANIIPREVLSKNLVIGATNTGSGVSNSLNGGYIDEFRISSSSRYTAPFSASSLTAFTADANTIFLHHFNGKHNSAEWNQGQEVPALWSSTPVVLSPDTNIVNVNSVSTQQLEFAKSRERIISLGSLQSPTFTISLTGGSSYVLTPSSSSLLTCWIRDTVPLNPNQMYTLSFLIDSSTFKSFISSLNVNGNQVSIFFNNGINSVNVSAASLVHQTISLIFTQTSNVPLCVSSVVPYQSSPLIIGTFQLLGTSTTRYHLITGTTTIQVSTPTTINYMIVGGGGGGGMNGGGGGGAGGVLIGSLTLQPNVQYTLAIGTGGAGTTPAQDRPGLRGTDTLLRADRVTLLTAFGGGGGGNRDQNGIPTSGGSGGGGGPGGIVAFTIGASGVAGQGNRGGDSSNLGTNSGGGGGGGYGSVGGNSSSQTGGSGGTGYQSPVTGTWYGAGGGGGLTVDGTANGIGGSGVGGNGGRNALAATSGAANTGSGGGGGGPSGNGFSAGNGADGVILLTGLVPAGITGSYSISTSSGINILSFTNSGGTLRLSESTIVTYFIVGGGGGGGGGGTNGGSAGGGSGGGVLLGTTTLSANVTYTITVGAGGAGAPQNQTAAANQGGDSAISGSGFSTLTAIGGGAGGNRTSFGTPTTGGSGGGGAGSATVGFRTGAAGTPGQGNLGGNGIDGGVTNSAGGGGGGYGSAGGNAASAVGGAGGSGYNFPFTNTSYAAGGGGGLGTAGTVSAVGGSSIGGNGGRNNVNATSGAANTGSGGGGAGAGTSTAGNGANGIVIFVFKSLTIPV